VLCRVPALAITPGARGVVLAFLLRGLRGNGGDKLPSCFSSQQACVKASRPGGADMSPSRIVKVHVGGGYVDEIHIGDAPVDAVHIASIIKFLISLVHILLTRALLVARHLVVVL